MSRPLSLYRSILRVHRNKLPSNMRGLGDSYVRQEFQAHKKATVPQARIFFKQWEDYVRQIESASDEKSVGRSMDEREVASMSEEQKAKLEEVAREFS